MQYFTMARQKVFIFYLCVQFLSPSFISTKRCCNIIVSPVWGDFVFTRVNFPRVCLCRKHTRGCAGQPCRMPRVFVRRLFSAPTSGAAADTEKRLGERERERRVDGASSDLCDPHSTTDPSQNCVRPPFSSSSPSLPF